MRNPKLFSSLLICIFLSNHLLAGSDNPLKSHTAKMSVAKTYNDFKELEEALVKYSLGLAEEKFCTYVNNLTGKELTLIENAIDQIQETKTISCYDPLKIRIANFSEKGSKPQVAQAAFFFSTKTYTTENQNVSRLDEQGELDITNQYPLMGRSYGHPSPLLKKQVILTFDDGPSFHNGFSQKILNLLALYNARAMYFFVGQAVKNSSKCPEDKCHELAYSAHISGSHSHTHRSMTKISSADAVSDIEKGHLVVEERFGQTPFFRFPYGNSGQEIRDKLTEKGFHSMWWAIDSNDWKYSSDEIYSTVTSQLEKKQGGIILFHEIQRSTVNILGALLDYLALNNYELIVLTSAQSIQY